MNVIIWLVVGGLIGWVAERQLGVVSDPDDTAASTIVLN